MGSLQMKLAHIAVTLVLDMSAMKEDVHPVASYEVFTIFDT